jgi:hypothetical protein
MPEIEETEFIRKPETHRSGTIHLAADATLDDAVEEVLEGEPRAAVWHDLREALQGRLADAIAQRDETPKGSPEREEWEVRVAELREQVAALAQEEAITEFVERSVRVALTRPHIPGLEDWDEYDAGL